MRFRSKTWALILWLLFFWPGAIVYAIISMRDDDDKK